jgi:hypothetical protein
VKSPVRKLPKNTPVVQKKQESSSEESSSEEDEPKAKVVATPLLTSPKSPVKTPAKPALLTKKQESSSEDSDDSKYSGFTYKCVFLGSLVLHIFTFSSPESFSPSLANSVSTLPLFLVWQ